MADITQAVENIRQARFGPDVRESIASALEAMNENAENAEAWVTGGEGGTPGEENNAKYYAELAEQSAETFTTDKTLTQDDAAADAAVVGEELSKIKSTIERNVPFSSLNVFSEGRIMKTNGELQSGTAHKVVSIKVGSISNIEFVVSNVSTELPFIILKNKYGEVVKYITVSTNGTYSFAVPYGNEDGTIYINWFNGRTDTPSTICDNANFITGNVWKITNDLNNILRFDYPFNRMENAKVGGYMNASGAFVGSASHRCVSIPTNGIKGIGINKLSGDTSLVMVVVKDGNGDVVDTLSIQNNNEEIKLFPTGSWDGCTAYFNFYNYNSQSICNKATIYAYDGTFYLTVLDKTKRNFAGAKCYFFGDSITAGYINGTDVTPDSFPLIFCDSLGATLINNGIASSLFTSGYNNVETIVHKVKNTDLGEADYILICGGVNDCQLGVTESDFKEAISSFCTWLKSHTIVPVIFVLPINFSKYFSSEILPLDMYRKYIKLYASINGFDVIDTTDYGFPAGTSPTETELAQLLFGDGLHPSVLGHEFYGKRLAQDKNLLYS